MIRNIFNRKYKFSVIIPIYNTASYLEDAIESIIDQTIGFEENIQLILVNDGSPDESESICKRYRKRYPRNIKYIFKSNGGVSAARNLGLKKAKGQIINFFDSDDCWQPDAFQKAYDMFCNYGEQIDIVTCRQILFEAKEGEHRLNDKFEGGDRVINIFEEPFFPVITVTSSFIKREAIKDRTFDIRIDVGEDAKFMTQILLDKEQYGVLASTHNNIRRRHSKTSITQNPTKGRYTATMVHYYKYVRKLSIEKYGKVIPYIQYLLLNGLRYRVVSNRPLPLDENERQLYFKRVKSILAKLDDEVILNAKDMKMPLRVYLLRVAHPKLTFKRFRKRGNRLYFKGYKVGNMAYQKVYVDKVEENRIEGHINVPFYEDICLNLLCGENAFPAKIRANPSYERLAFNGDIIIPGRSFDITLPNNINLEEIRFELNIDGVKIIQKDALI